MRRISKNRIAEDGREVGPILRIVIRRLNGSNDLVIGQAMVPQAFLTFRGYTISMMCVRLPFSLVALQLVHTTMFFASMPSSCVIGDGADCVAGSSVGG